MASPINYLLCRVEHTSSAVLSFLKATFCMKELELDAAAGITYFIRSLSMFDSSL